MGALTTESSNQTSSAPAATRDVSDLRVITPNASDRADPFGSGTKFGSFSSPSSSPDSTLDDPFLEFDIEHDESTSTITAVPTTRPQQVSEHGKSPQIPKPTPGPGSSDQSTPKMSPGYAFESPPSQVMERNNNSKYRIPSSVFARNKSNAPDWSMASNESLFSIHMGGMSFTDHYSFMKSGELGLKSGELGLVGEPSTSNQKLGLSQELSMSDQMLASSGEPYQNYGTIPTEVGKSQDLGVGVDDSMKGVPSEYAEDRKSNGESRISHYSMESASSTKSFAFPLLEGEKDKLTSARIGSSEKLDPETPKTSVQQPLTEPTKEPEPKTPAAAATAVAPQNNWFSCFPCCS